ncbi:NfeD family protein [uncultured Rikenella sp.]|uniref:NfeD family protein n=1 Tax=uncultured Rikenella sp. TaxID=368003 RepID=UPI0026390F79|nr:NfeD family protein [uncultured Rikenella sp.]
MEIWHIWTLVAIVFLFIELFDTRFGMFCLAVGAGISALLSGLGSVGLTGQLIGFLIGIIIAFIGIRPFILRWLHDRRKGTDLQTNADALIGKTGRVTETIDPGNGTGYILIDGDLWKATSLNNETIPSGTMAVVVHRESILLTVKPTQPC